MSHYFVKTLNNDGSAAAVQNQLQEPICGNVAGCKVIVHIFIPGSTASFTEIEGETSVTAGTNQAHLRTNFENLRNTNIVLQSMTRQVTAAKYSSNS